jgi:hypothetical protein
VNKYYDADGKECTLRELVLAEPEWAINTLEKQRQLLRAMVNAQHAGPITDEMYAAWEAAREYLEGSV